MAADTFPAALALVLAHEGGYVDHPLDPGGATNMGITRATLAGWRGRPVAKAEVMALGRAEAAAIYRARYWNAVQADELPAGVDLVVFDAAVNSGPARAMRWLQQAMGLPPDGVMGPMTLDRARAADAADTIRAFGRLRLAFLARLTTWRAFGRGWSRRVRETETAALALVGRPASGTTPTRPKETIPMNDTKSLLTSRTLWSNLVGLSALLLSIVGLDGSALDHEGLSQAIPQAIAAGSFIASTIFRVTATKRIALT